MRETRLQSRGKNVKHAKDLSFAVFFVMWAKTNKWEVPAFHWEVVQFLDSHDDWEKNIAVLQVFRGAGKSTIVGLYIVYRLVKDPTLRFLVLSADDRSAQRITQDCRAIITRHPLATHLRGKETEWKAHRFTVVGATDARNPSVSAHGITSNVTSARADIVIYDDVEVPKTCSTEDTRYMLRTKLQESTHILVPGGKKLYIGTPHAFESIYPELIDTGVSSLTLPLLPEPEGEFPNMTGESRWSERFTEEDVLSRQAASTKGNFLSQYQLMPVNTEDSYLDSTEVRTYEDEIDWFYSQGQLQATINGELMAGVSAFWDPALAGKQKRGDASVLAIVFSDTKGNYYVHRLIPLKGDPDEQCEMVKDAALRWRLSVVHIETNGIGNFLPAILLKHVRGLGIGVNGVFTSVKKETKILEAIETPLYAGALKVHRTVLDTPFLSQVRDFNPKGNKDKDDYLDSTASAIAQGPIRIGRGSTVSGDPVARWGEVSAGGSVEVEMTRL